MSLIFIFRTILFLQYKFSRICASLQFFFWQITYVEVYEMLWISRQYWSLFSTSMFRGTLII